MPFAYKRQALGPSGLDGHNFVWRHSERPVYMMDNHGAALWCWLRELELAEAFSVIHIDYHTDAGVVPERDLLFTLPPQPAFEEFLALQSGQPHLRGRPLVTWDNYLHALGVLRPAGHVFRGLVHQEPDRGGGIDLPFERVEWFHSPQAHMIKWINELPGRLLINLDLDYFFLNLDSGHARPAFASSYVEWLVAALLSRAPQNAIWTVAWSPECCGGWRAAKSVAEVVDRILGTGFPFNELPVR